MKFMIVAITSAAILLSSMAIAEECVAPPFWFTNGRTTEFDYSKPLDPQNDCDFYEFGWQTFLFVMQPDDPSGSRPKLLDFATPSDVFGANAPMAFPKKRDGLLSLSPRAIKSRNGSDFTTIFQALSGGAVVDKNGRSLYFGLHMNSTFVDFLRKHKLDTVGGINAADAKLEFPPGSLEFKSSWRIVASGEDTSKYFTTKALVPTLVEQNNQVVVDPNITREETVALVGLHVVGVAKGHPEFIWATFEHVENSPDLLAGHSSPTAPVSEDDWTFYKAKTPFNQSNIPNSKKDSEPLRITDAANQTLAPITQVFRHYPFGGEEPRGIITLNGSVHEKLPVNSVLKQYEMIGAVWINDPAAKFKENSIFRDDVLAGATKLSNSTMETFTQNTAKNCFSCHHTRGEREIPNTPYFLPAKRISVSHMLMQSYSQAKQKEFFDLQSKSRK